MSPEPLCFFSIDRGTASTAAALIGRMGGRFRLLGSATVPSELPLEPLLEGIVRRVAADDPTALPGSDTWPDWARLDASSRPAGRLVCAAASERRADAVETAVANAGWEVAGRITQEALDPLAATELCLAPDVSGVVVGAAEPAAPEEKEAVGDVAALVAAAAGRRPELVCVLAGSAAESAGLFRQEQVVAAPAPEPVAPRDASALRTTLEVLASRGPHLEQPSVAQDVRHGFRASIVSLASLLERRIEAVDVGASRGTRVLADRDGLRGSLTRADGALVPSAALHDDRAVDGILHWSPLRGDQLALRDRVRNLRLAPWRGATGDGARLRLAAARAALQRLDQAWTRGSDGDGRSASPADLLIASGGAFGVAPAPAVALALLDTLRRPGAIALLHDHARLLGPLGTLEDESDRRRLLADLLDDAFVPLGSAILASGLRPGRQAGTVRLSGQGGTTQVELVPGAVQLIDLPPGVAATAELETREGAWLGVRARHVALEVAGGLGGLLLDTREIPLRLPDRSDRRRELLDRWQRPLWVGGDS